MPERILTYSQTGAQFGPCSTWTMIPITVALIVVQEMCPDGGSYRQGSQRLIREEYGLHHVPDDVGHSDLISGTW